MNLYFLVEGRHTEKKVYPKWLSHLLPELTEIADPFKVSINNFYVFNGNGFPSLLDNHLSNAVADINSIGKFHYLVICLDADDQTVKERKNEVLSHIKKKNLKLKTGTFTVIVQNKCIETWFLGNRKIYSKQPQSIKLRRYNKFYNVQENDPELMEKMPGFSTVAQFHQVYLTEMLLEKNIRYTKTNPKGVTEKHYLNEIIHRLGGTNHLASFKEFLDFCTTVKFAITKKHLNV